MHLKSLTLRGFKSFASSTTLRFEPGITAVVGPNGSGKSNVVDAIAWVLGEQGAKALRGGSMQDVIFAGTAGRPPLGRAEVVLTIDNSDGALPIDYTEVSVSRLMFRSGESEYAINGSPCRLLDIQELMSDSGIGRELHVVVGQGQLDAVLHAKPEDRRGFIEEAAGVLKHRKRKERAVRKLDAMQANLARVTDLTAELRRQLTPLGRQAEVARRAGAIAATLRDARLRLLADDVDQLLRQAASGPAPDASAAALVERTEADLTAALARESALTEELAAHAPRHVRAQEVWFLLSALTERLRGTERLALERVHHLGADLGDAPTGRAPEDLEREAETAAEQQARAAADVEAARVAAEQLSAERVAADAELTAQEQAVARAQRAAADRREGLAKLAGQVAAVSSRLAAAREEIARQHAAAAEALARADAGAAEAEQLGVQADQLEQGETGLDERHAAAEDRLGQVEQRLAAAREQRTAADREVAELRARRDALALSLERKDGHGALRESAPAGLLGALAELVTVEPGVETALAAALGPAADALVVAGLDEAVAALGWLAERRVGQATVVVATTGAAPAGPVDPGGPGRPLAAAVRPDPRVAGTLAVLLRDVVLVEDLTEATALLRQRPGARAVTRGGTLLDGLTGRGGAAGAPSHLEMQVAYDDAVARHDAATARLAELATEVDELTEARGRGRAEVNEALEALHQSDAHIAAVSEALARIGAGRRAAQEEAGRLRAAAERTAANLERDQQSHAELSERLVAAQAEPAEPLAEDAGALDAAREAATAARAADMEARLALRSAEERLRSVRGRSEALRRAAEQARIERARAQERRRRRAAAAGVAQQVAEVAAAALAAATTSLERAAAEREAAAAARATQEEELGRVRARSRALGDELARLRDAAHREELARAERELRLETLYGRAQEEFGVAPEDLVGEYGPDRPVPGIPEPDGLPVEPVPYVRAQQEKRAATAERQYALLGKVNPLALEEFAALEERHAFLAAQLEDLKNTRRELLGIVREVDGRIHEVFAAAYADTAREFDIVFKTLFPGGEGRLELTDPDDLTVTGVEVHARPAGKKVTRLSLLSGGERSLAAIAFLVALFRARPSPFYVLDEVEAALDDRNLSRLLEALQGLRRTSQLIIITHQKRTMEIADALYGVTMQGDGVSTVISQRLRDRGAVDPDASAGRDGAPGSDGAAVAAAEPAAAAG